MGPLYQTGHMLLLLAVQRAEQYDPLRGRDTAQLGCSRVLCTQCLEREGAHRVFAYPGGASLEIHQALTRSPVVQNTLCRHEQVFTSAWVHAHLHLRQEQHLLHVPGGVFHESWGRRLSQLEQPVTALKTAPGIVCSAMLPRAGACKLAEECLPRACMPDPSRRFTSEWHICMSCFRCCGCPVTRPHLCWR